MTDTNKNDLNFVISFLEEEKKKIHKKISKKRDEEIEESTISLLSCGDAQDFFGLTIAIEYLKEESSKL